jgi:uncharacterized OB-fold protein
VTASGRGRVYSYTAVMQSRMPPFDALVPYVVALVEMEEGPRMLTNITDCPAGDVHIDMPVTFYSSEIHDGISVAFWRPTAAAAEVPT